MILIVSLSSTFIPFHPLGLQHEIMGWLWWGQLWDDHDMIMKAAILLFWFFMKDIQQPLKMQTADCHHGDGFVHLQGPPRGGIGIGPFFRSRISRIPNYILECPRWRIQVLQTSTNESANISEELIWIHTYVYIYICICMYMYVCIYVDMYIYKA